jgi:hypothetical protein
MLQSDGTSNRTDSRGQVIDLTPCGREGVFDGYSSMFAPCFVSACMVHHDVLVRGNRQPNVDLKSDPVAMLVTGSDHLYAAACNALVMIL